MALIPSHFSNAVVAIGNKVDDGEVQWIGTAFFYGREVVGAPVGDEGQVLHETFLVTNRHVLDALTSPVIRANPGGSTPATEMPLLLDWNGDPAWATHPDPEVDVAVTGVGIDPLIDAGFEVSFIPSGHSLTVDEMTSSGFSEGDGMFVLGFPMGLVGQQRGTAIVRSGTLARFSELRDGHTKDMIVDAYVFPGNSGGPVFTKPETIAIQGTESHPSAFLVGVVASYYPYRDLAVSPQTGNLRVVFEENSGLASVFPVNCINETADAFKALQSSPKEVPTAATDDTEPAPASSIEQD